MISAISSFILCVVGTLYPLHIDLVKLAAAISVMIALIAGCLDRLQTLARKTTQVYHSLVQDVATYIVAWSEFQAELRVRNPHARLTDMEKEFILRFHRVFLLGGVVFMKKWRELATSPGWDHEVPPNPTTLIFGEQVAHMPGIVTVQSSARSSPSNPGTPSAERGLCIKFKYCKLFSLSYVTFSVRRMFHFGTLVWSRLSLV
ncbi:hypothetical protein IW262DRAFT_1059583 [Armillaria fumosa]|nr:hypothetical protein IW262DRAFT_1059583 [Armillaria fumosa]